MPNPPQKKRVFLTGATGFLGPRSVQYLLERGLLVRVLIRDEKKLQLLEAFPIEICRGSLADLNPQHITDCEYFIHMASAVSLCRKDDHLLEETNVRGTQKVVEICAAVSGIRLVHVSSVAAFGASVLQGPLLSEDFFGDGLNYPNYSSKFRADSLVREACRSRGLDAVIANLPLVVGAGDAVKAARKGLVLTAAGKNPVYSNGGVNVVSKEDAVRGIWLAAEQGRSGENYILGGRNMRLQDLYQRFSQVTQRKAPSKKIPTFLLRCLGWLAGFFRGSSLRPESTFTATAFHWFDSSKAREELGFVAEDPQHAIEESVQWMKNHGYF